MSRHIRRAFLVSILIWAAVVYAVPAVVDWNTPATLEYDSCFGCTDKPTAIETTITWAPGIAKRIVFPNNKVRLGPFHIKKSAFPRPGFPSLPVGFNISVWARSPAVFTPDGHFVGSTPQLVRIGSVGTTIRQDEDEQDLYVIVDLPGVFNAVQLRASINGTQKTSAFPTDCSDLPAANGSPTVDENCMQAAVNPLAVVLPSVVPLTIIYEPPGNCSYAKLTQTDAVGATLMAQDSQSTATRTLEDPGILASLFGAQQEDTNGSKISQTSSISKISISDSRTFGTLLGPGLPDSCKDPAATLPPRDHSGPGQGDNFILLLNAPTIYWDTGNLTNFLPVGFVWPSSSLRTRTVQVFAWELASADGLAELAANKGVTFTQDQANAILSLDPLTRTGPALTEPFGPFFYPKLPKRFILLNEPASTFGPRNFENDVILRREVVEADSQTCSESGSTNTQDEDLLTKIFVKGLIFDIGAGAKTIGGDGTSKDLGDVIGDSIKDITPSQILGGQQTQTTLTYTSCKNLENMSEADTTEEYLVEDTNSGFTIVKYYDSAFGTVAFVPLPRQEMSLIRTEPLRSLDLPNFVWAVNVKQGEQINQEMPSELAQKLKALGFKRLEPARAEDLAMSRKFTKGGFRGAVVDMGTGRISGTVAKESSGIAQQMLFVVNSDGKRVAQLWLNEVAAKK